MQAMSRNLREVPKRRSKIANDRTCETPVLRPRGNDLWPEPGSQYGPNPAKRWIHSGGEIGPRPNASLLYEACFELAGSGSLERNVSCFVPQCVTRIASRIL